MGLYRTLLNWIPRPLLIRGSYALRPFLPLFFAGDRFEDPIDGKKYRKLLPYGYGEVQRPNALSPSTLSLERHRLLWLYLSRKTDFLSRAAELLHFAPEQCFYARFKKLPNLRYVTADIDSPLADLSVDVQDLPLEDNRFDWIFCNHVLEHVPDDRKALSELYRVLKPGGTLIAQVPQRFDWEKTLEDPSITDRKERERLFGQYDHLRMYGRDYPERLKEAGFEVRLWDAAAELGEQAVNRYALPKGELLPVALKPLS